MSLQKLRPFALAFFLLLLCGTFALAQANNPPLTDDQAAGVAAGGAFFCVCAAIIALVGLAIKIGIMVFVYKDAKARGSEPMLWLVLAFFFDIIVLIIWLIVRPPLQGPPV